MTSAEVRNGGGPEGGERKERVSWIEKLGRLDGSIVALAVLLSLAGIVAVQCATHFRMVAFWPTQAAWAGAGLVVFFLTSLIDYRWARWAALPILFIGTALQFLLYASRESHRDPPTLDHFSTLTRLQPAQWALVGGILTVGLFLTRFRGLFPIEKLIFVGIIVSGPLIVTLSERDFGMALVWVPVVFSMLFAAGLPKRYLLALLALGAAAAPLVGDTVPPYPRPRILTQFDPEVPARAAARPVPASLQAIRIGGWDGAGLLNTSAAVERGFSPGTSIQREHIFSVIAEQFGFVGGAGLLAFFALLILAMLRVAHRAADDFGLLLTVGFTTQIVAHVGQNVGAALGLLPLTGRSLPFLSYDTTFLLVIWFGLGLVHSVGIHRRFRPDAAARE